MNDCDHKFIDSKHCLKCGVSVETLTTERDAEVRAMHPLAANERHIMAHSTAWDGPRRQRLYRNHFCAGPGHDDWQAIQGLCARGLMKLSRDPSPLSGGDSVFAVTAVGIEALRASVAP